MAAPSGNNASAASGEARRRPSKAGMTLPRDGMGARPVSFGRAPRRRGRCRERQVALLPPLRGTAVRQVSRGSQSSRGKLEKHVSKNWCDFLAWTACGRRRRGRDGRHQDRHGLLGQPVASARSPAARTTRAHTPCPRKHLTHARWGGAGSAHRLFARFPSASSIFLMRRPARHPQLVPRL